MAAAGGRGARAIGWEIDEGRGAEAVAAVAAAGLTDRVRHCLLAAALFCLPVAVNPGQDSIAWQLPAVGLPLRRERNDQRDANRGCLPQCPQASVHIGNVLSEDRAELWPLLASTLASAGTHNSVPGGGGSGSFDGEGGEGGLVVLLYLSGYGLKKLWRYLRDALLAAAPGAVRVLTYVYDFDAATKAQGAAAAGQAAGAAGIVSTKVWCTGR